MALAGGATVVDTSAVAAAAVMPVVPVAESGPMFVP
jgi:hypothetical protein